MHFQLSPLPVGLLMQSSDTSRIPVPLVVAFLLGGVVGSLLTALWMPGGRRDGAYAGPDPGSRVGLRGQVLVNGSPLAEGTIRFTSSDPRNLSICGAFIRD